MKVLSSVARLMIIFSCVAFSVRAQQPTGKITLQKPKAAPTMQDSVRMLNQPRLRITELNQADKLKVINEALKKRGLPTTNNLTPGTTVKLSLSNAASGGETFLFCFEPHILNFASNVAQFNSSDTWFE